jgi:mono/diheme cytochrome c family protein
MASQPSFRPLRPTSFFEDGRSARPLVPGTVARGHLRDDPLLYEGLAGHSSAETRAAGTVAALAHSVPGVTPALASAVLYLAADPYAAEFPALVTREALERGRVQFNIFCAVCHDAAGTGRGIVVRRGFTQPPPLASPRLRQARAGYIFHVITNGHGAMPDYADLLPAEDRWDIVAWVRVLQRSQAAGLDDVPAAERARLEKEARPK